MVATNVSIERRNYFPPKQYRSDQDVSWNQHKSQQHPHAVLFISSAMSPRRSSKETEAAAGFTLTAALMFLPPVSTFESIALIRRLTLFRSTADPTALETMIAN